MVSSAFLDAYSDPTPTNLDMNSVFEIAERAAQHFGYDNNGDIHTVVENLGGKIKLKDFWSEGSHEAGSLIVDSENDFVIYIPVDTSEVRDRFTIAHELGHYVLHYLWPRQVKGRADFKLKASRYGSDRAEWEANWFAAAFLMPRADFTNLVKKKKLTLQELAKHFSVSIRAVETRAKVLGVDTRD